MELWKTCLETIMLKAVNPQQHSHSNRANSQRGLFANSTLQLKLGGMSIPLGTQQHKTDSPLYADLHVFLGMNKSLVYFSGN